MRTGLAATHVEKSIGIKLDTQKVDAQITQQTMEPTDLALMIRVTARHGEYTLAAPHTLLTSLNQNLVRGRMFNSWV